jgi:transcription-repair coupling factor (superfamily II helicase)
VNFFLDRLVTHPLIDAFSRADVTFSHVSLTQEAILAATTFKAKPQTIVWVKANLYQAERLHAKLQWWLGDQALLVASEESLRVEAIAASPELNVGRIDALSKVIDGTPHVIVTHLGAFLRYLPTPQTFSELTLHIHADQIITPKGLLEQLRRMGYTETAKVDQPATMAHRGGIVDVFPINCDEPIRIEFFDNLIESIRTFDLSTQRSLETIKALDVDPASDLIFTDLEIETILTRLNQRLTSIPDAAHRMRLQETIDRDLELMRLRVKENHLYRYRCLCPDTATLTDYLKDPLIVLSTEEDLQEHRLTLVTETTDYLKELVDDHQALPFYDVYADYARTLAGHRTNALKRFEAAPVHLPFRELDVPVQTLATHVNLLEKQLLTKTVVCCLKEAEIKELVPHLQERHIPYKLRFGTHDDIKLILLHKDLDEGFELLDAHIVVYSSKELFNHKVFIGRYSTKFKEAQTLQSYQDLQPGDYVVHHQHGVGQYLGIITREFEGRHRDYLHIVYKANAALYVPLEQFQLVRKFVSKEGVVPKLHTLGSSEWKKTKAKLKQNVLELAERLIALYGTREQAIAYAFGPDSDLQKAFEDEFEYPLTPDQSQAVDDIKSDLRKPVPMDRLLCGDVGFGKTEVAIRAAFKVVAEHKQVAFLCPTTVLSAQHYHTFSRRYKNYPINVALINRFTPDSHVKTILEGLKHGQIDVLIGTHRLLSKDVQFKDLGLLVVDEEQRFGVEHKEKIKELRMGVHVLSLSATPIPRTLQMSLVGVRAYRNSTAPHLTAYRY